MIWRPLKAPTIRHRYPSLLPVALAGLLVPAGAALLAAQPASGPVVTSVEFRGLSSVDSADVRSRLAIREGDPLERPKIAESLRALYGMRVFSLISVEREPEPAGGVRLIWDFQERPRVVAVTFEGYDHLGEADLKQKIGLRAGRLLDLRLLEKDRRAVVAAYAEEGYPQAQVRPAVEPREAGVAVVFRIEEGQRAKIREIDFTGNEAFSDEDLRDRMKLKKKSLFRSGRFSQEKLEEDKERIVSHYKNHGFKDARVLEAATAYSQDGEDLRITIRVDEGPRYVFGDVRWEGSSVFSEEELMRATRLRPREPYSQERLDQTVSEAYSLYTEKGYLLGLYIDPVLTTHADTVDALFRVQEGEPSHVHDVLIQGNTRTREYVIRRELDLAPGDLLRRSLFMRSQRDLMALGFFEDVQVDYRPAGQGTDIDIIFRVEEKSTGTASAGAGFSSDTGLTGFVDLGHNNLFGRGQSVQLHLERGGRRKNYSFSFTEPWLFGRPTTLGFSVFNTERVLDLYTEKRSGGSVRAGRPWFFEWPDYTRVYVSYTLEDLSFEDLEGLDPESIEFLSSGAGRVSEMALTFLRSSTDNPFYPTLGSEARWRTEVAGGPLGGDLDYIKSTVDIRQYFVPFWKPTVMLRYKVGHLAGITSADRVPGNETFRLGGTTFEHLRGYDDFYVVPEENVRHTASGREIRFPGGKFMFTFTAEYQFPIVSPVHGLLFYDAGNTWNAVDDFSLSNLKQGVGVGVRLEIPMLGQVGLDYAYNVERGRFRTHLILGPSF